jgi:dTDP-4-dehydrorhamnose reductase
MKYLITGANGQLGREWVHHLKENNAEFRACNSDELDITVKSEVSAAVKEYRPDVIINCAAYTNVDLAESEPDKAFEVNEDGVKNLTECCKDAGIKLVHYSTDYVFSGSEADSKEYPDGYPEDAIADPVNMYGKSKRAGEKILESSNIDWLLIRVSWLCGPSGSNFVNTMIRVGDEQNVVSVVQDQYGCPTFTFDVVKKTIELLGSDKSGIFNISCLNKISWADFAEEIFRQTGINVKVERISSSEFPSKSVRPKYSLLSVKKIENTGLMPLYWIDGLRELIRRRNQQI